MQITKLTVWINRLDANMIGARIKVGLNARLNRLRRSPGKRGVDELVRQLVNVVLS